MDCEDRAHAGRRLPLHQGDDGRLEDQGQSGLEEAQEQEARQHVREASQLNGCQESRV